MLVDVLREQREYEKADKLLRELVQESPDDVNLAAALVQVVSLEAAEAAAAGNTERQRALDEKASTMIAEYRKRYPDNVTFLQAECDLVARGGDWTRAIAITQEIDKVAKSTGAGALIRARIFAQQDKPSEVAKAYAECLDANPRQPDVRVLLAQELVKLGEYDEALKQARMVLDGDKDRLDAILWRPGPWPSRAPATRRGRRPARRPSSGSRRRSPSSRDSSRPITRWPRSRPGGAGGPRRSRRTGAT